MKKVKYYYNTQSLRYEKLVVPLRVKLLRAFGFLSAALVTSFIIVSIANRFIASPHDKELQQELSVMQDKYQALGDQMQTINSQLLVLQNRDNNIYRAIFAAAPLPDSARAHQMARSNEYKSLQNDENADLIVNADSGIAAIEARINAQQTSYNELDKLVKNRAKMLASIPAIQPVSNKDLSRIASGFGYRIDPIYKTVKFHPGLDFAAPQGTPIYATGDGVVEWAGMDNSGYGIHVIIRHGYGYETLYGHMVRTIVHAGQHVKRGEVIGYVGSTGKSTGPHCHYEVIRNGVKMNPVYFFYNDLTPQQYQRILKMAASNNESLD